MSTLPEQIAAIDKEIVTLQGQKAILKHISSKRRTPRTIEKVVRDAYVVAIGEHCYVKDTSITEELNDVGENYDDCEYVTPSKVEDRMKALTAMGLVPIYTKDRVLLGWSGLRAHHDARLDGMRSE